MVSFPFHYLQYQQLSRYQDRFVIFPLPWKCLDITEKLVCCIKYCECVYSNYPIRVVNGIPQLQSH